MVFKGQKRAHMQIFKTMVWPIQDLILCVKQHYFIIGYSGQM